MKTHAQNSRATATTGIVTLLLEAKGPRACSYQAPERCPRAESGDTLSFIALLHGNISAYRRILVLGQRSRGTSALGRGFRARRRAARILLDGAKR